ncbi:hypothetical protein ACHQM5_002989 [Ranunculus cassubicifolius]
MEDNTDTISNWGTWEELVLGGAVLRHGTHSWDTVAAELRSRTFYPYFFTPEVCKAKYQDLQKRYSGCTAWFEELRKQRVAELKRELEKSEGSIGSLESKLVNLKSEKNEHQDGNYAAGHTESPPSVGNVARLDFPSKETSKDGFSVGSFTEETQTDSSPEFRIPAIVTENKNEEGENATSKETILKKRRGKRKRKDIAKEVIEANLSRDYNQVVRVGDNDRAVRSSNDDDDNDRTVDMGNIELLNLLNSIIESQNLSVFQRRTDSQRRGKYKKTIRQHMDLSFMRSRISDRSISSHKELYRDLLLLCNNAILFYSKESREYKSAISLRAFVTKMFREKLRLAEFSSDKPMCSNPPIVKPPISLPVKPRSARPSHPKAAGKSATVASPLILESKKVKDTEILADVVGKKKPVKVGRGGGSKRVETPANGSGRKKARKR